MNEASTRRETARADEDDLSRAEALGRWILDIGRSLDLISPSFSLSWNRGEWTVTSHATSAHQIVAQAVVLYGQPLNPCSHVPSVIDKITINWSENMKQRRAALTVVGQARIYPLRLATLRNAFAPAFAIERLGCPVSAAVTPDETCWTAEAFVVLRTLGFSDTTVLGRGATADQALADATLRAGLLRAVLGHDTGRASMNIVEVRSARHSSDLRRDRPAPPKPDCACAASRESFETVPCPLAFVRHGAR